MPFLPSHHHHYHFYFFLSFFPFPLYHQYYLPNNPDTLLAFILFHVYNKQGRLVYASGDALNGYVGSTMREVDEEYVYATCLKEIGCVG